LDAVVDIRTTADGTVVVQPHGIVGVECSVELQQALVHAVRRLRPHRLILDLADVRELDSINVGTVAAICDLGADHQVAVFIDDPAPAIATKLHAAGVHHRHLRTTT
jgi:anti-anti-sigma regulatory factor